ncbi:MAG: zinc ribbon domain-containing protein [Gemmatimonadota bacterium]|nr:zinc ribbon domain-containing protein [Gemmatimonadota bacterium]
MPTYEYRCPDGHRFEVFQKMSDDPTAACPECGAAAERLISGGAGFLFRGEGFYITDYRSDEYREKASKEAPAAEGGGTESGGKGEGGGKGDGASSGGDTGGGDSGGGDGGGGEKKGESSASSTKPDS